MRLLITTDTVGGVWTFTRELSTGLLETGCAVALVSIGREPDAGQLHSIQGLQRRWAGQFMSQHIVAPLEWMEENQTAYTAAESTLLAIAGKFRADILHANQFCFGALPGSLPRVLTAHSDVLSWAEACGRAPLSPSPWIGQYRALVSAGLGHAQAVAAPTHWMLNALGENFPLPREATVIPNGRTLHSPNRARRLQAITAGRLWDEAKGISLLASVDSPMPLLIAGEEEASRSSQTLPQARLLGLLSEADLLNHFAESSVYICTSIYEPFGLAPLEAALCGCAVLARDIPSLREVWGEAALYFGNAQELSEQLDHLNRDPHFLRGLQLRSAEQAKKYTRAAMTGSYMRLFERVIANHGAKKRVA